jgi:hypothetical protein
VLQFDLDLFSISVPGVGETMETRNHDSANMTLVLTRFWFLEEIKSGHTNMIEVAGVVAIKTNIFMMSTNENNITNNNQDDNDESRRFKSTISPPPCEHFL